MISDTLANAGQYDNLSVHFAKAFAFLRKVDGTQSLGRHEIDGNNVFALIQKYTTKPMESAQFEVHRKYIDVQYVHTGRETILWAPLAAMKEEKMAYNEEKDAALFKLVPDLTHLHLDAGYFSILYPQDAHAPRVAWEKTEEVLKVVIKVITN